MNLDSLRHNKRLTPPVFLHRSDEAALVINAKECMRSRVFVLTGLCVCRMH
jgi:hypothetical protein